MLNDERLKEILYHRAQLDGPTDWKHALLKMINRLEAENERLRDAITDALEHQPYMGTKAAQICTELRRVLEANDYGKSQKRITQLKAENERLAECCTRRGARMQMMYQFLNQKLGLGGPGEWWYFVEERPEASNWFDEDGVPVETTQR